MHPIPARRARRGLAAAAIALIVAIPAAGWAASRAGNQLSASIGVRGALVGAYDYSSATDASWDPQADFAAGSHTDTSDTALPGYLTLKPLGETIPDISADGWWDTRWKTRQCFDIDHTAPGAKSVTEYQIAVTIDTATEIAAGRMRSNGADLRAVASDAATTLPMWVEGPIDDPTTIVWVQVDAIPAASATTFCVYWNRATPTSVSDADSVFTHTTRKPIYYAVSSRFDAPGAPIRVASLVGSNRVGNGTSISPLLGAGGLHSFPAAENSSVTVLGTLGPLTTRGDGNGFDSLVPVSFAGTPFVVPSARSVQTLSIHAPFAAATVTVLNGTAPVTGSPFTVGLGATATVNADATGSRTLIVESTVPVLVTHVTTNSRDAIAVHPISPEDLYGVRSTTLRIGFSATTTGNIDFSNGTTQAFTARPRGSTTVAGGGSQGGAAADGVRISADQPLGAVQQADGDGADSTIFLPEGELWNEYYLPTDAQYIAVSCPVPGTRVRIRPPSGGPTTLTCVGSGGGPGWAKLASVRVAGTRIWSLRGEDFYAYYEHNGTGDETNLFGLKQGRQYTWPEPSVTPRLVAGQMTDTAGTWDSADFDTSTSGVFGTIEWQRNLPAGTSVRFQVATGATPGPSSFVGPDGTAGSWFTSRPDGLALSHDGDRYLRVRAELSTSNATLSPRIDSITVGTDLDRFPHSTGNPDGIAVPGTVGVTSRHFLARLRTPSGNLGGSSATLELLGSSEIGDVSIADLTLRPPDSLQVSIIGGTIIQAVGPPVAYDAAAMHSIVLDERMAASPAAATLDLR